MAVSIQPLSPRPDVTPGVHYDRLDAAIAKAEGRET